MAHQVLCESKQHNTHNNWQCTMLCAGRKSGRNNATSEKNRREWESLAGYIKSYTIYVSKGATWKCVTCNWNVQYIAEVHMGRKTTKEKSEYVIGRAKATKQIGNGSRQNNSTLFWSRLLCYSTEYNERIVRNRNISRINNIVRDTVSGVCGDVCAPFGIWFVWICRWRAGWRVISIFHIIFVVNPCLDTKPILAFDAHSQSNTTHSDTGTNHDEYLANISVSLVCAWFRLIFTLFVSIIRTNNFIRPCRTL